MAHALHTLPSYPIPSSRAQAEARIETMGVLATRSVHARPSAWPPINMSGNFEAHMSGGGAKKRGWNPYICVI